MRQGGMKPKGHNSGVYWTRAHGNTGGRKKKVKENIEEGFSRPTFGNIWVDISVFLFFFCIAGFLFFKFAASMAIKAML
jgi:hypothetical protein